MKKFIIITDSCSDLTKEEREKYDVEYIPMRIHFDEKEYPADLDWGDIAFEDYYQLMRDGVRIKTSQINANEYEEIFEKYINNGYDILSLSCSSALSNSVKSSMIAKENLDKKYPDAKIICVDTLNAARCLGTLCITASQLRAEGKTIEETADYILANKKKINQLCTVESLTYLKRAGRVSVASAVFGSLLQVKPIIISDINGQNSAVEKVKGRKNSMNRLVQMLIETYDAENKYQYISISHADCMEDAIALKEAIEFNLNPSVPVNIVPMGPIIGCTTGPGTLAVFAYGKEVTYDSKKN